MRRSWRRQRRRHLPRRPMGPPQEGWMWMPRSLGSRAGRLLGRLMDRYFPILSHMHPCKRNKNMCMLCPACQAMYPNSASQSDLIIHCLCGCVLLKCYLTYCTCGGRHSRQLGRPMGRYWFALLIAPCSSLQRRASLRRVRCKPSTPDNQRCPL